MGAVYSICPSVEMGAVYSICPSVEMYAVYSICPSVEMGAFGFFNSFIHCLLTTNFVFFSRSEIYLFVFRFFVYFPEVSLKLNQKSFLNNIIFFFSKIEFKKDAVYLASFLKN